MSVEVLRRRHPGRVEENFVDELARLDDLGPLHLAHHGGTLLPDYDLVRHDYKEGETMRKRKRLK